MPEKPNNNHSSETLSQIRGVKNCTRLQDKVNKRQSMAYNWNTQKNSEEDCENVDEIISNLLEKELISSDSAALLKKENQTPCNPLLVMDLRHEMVKMRNQEKQLRKTENAVSEGKRLVLHEEMEKIAIENELLIIDKEINSFKKQLELNKKRFSNKIKGTQLSVYKSIRFNTNRQYTTCNKPHISQLLLPSKNILKTEDSFPDIQHQISNNLKSSYHISRKSVGKVKIKTFCDKSNIPKIQMLPCKGVESNKAKEKEEISDLNQKTIYTKQYLIYGVLKKWKQYVLNKKIIRIAIKMEDKRNKMLLKKCWNTWIQVVKEKRRIVAAFHEKHKTDKKIDRFLKNLQEKKQALVAPALMKDLNKIPVYERKSNCFNQNSQTKTVKTKKQTAEIHARFQSKSAPSQLSRFEMQQNIIAKQKSKLEEQSKLIKELQLEQLKFQTKKSTKQTCEEINRTLTSCDLSLRPKVKQVQARLSTADGRIETSERIFTVRSLRVSPPILTKMEERAQEREKRWQMIKEKKLERIKDKEKQDREEEEERKRKEECEKRQKVEELKEKRRIEKEMEVQKQKEKERMIGLRIKAIHHYKQKLLKNGFEAMHQLVVIRRRQRIISENHYKLKLMHTCLHAWRRNVQSILCWKMQRAILLHNKQLMGRAFHGFLKVHSEYVFKCQVAVDFYDFHLEEHVFIAWHKATCAAYMETIYKLGKANVHYNRTLLRRCIKLWGKLPFVMRLEREKEKRKQMLRLKVQEMLPDYNPMYSMFDHDNFTY